MPAAPSLSSILLPLPADARSRRIVQLLAGLLLYGFSAALLVEASLGLDPWDVFHQGIARQTPLSIGAAVIAVSAVVLLLWIPMRQRLGLGTISNAIVIGLVIDATLVLVPSPEGVVLQTVLMIAAVVLNGLATGLYIGAGLGPGPRDGLMTGLAARGRFSIRAVRTAIEITVLVAGWLLGGTIGIGTVVYALSIGPLAQLFIPLFTIGPAVPARSPEPQPEVG